MVRWGEILAATTVVILIYHTLLRETDEGLVIHPRISNPYRPVRIPGQTKPYQYRDYDNLVIRDGRVVGGL